MRKYEYRELPLISPAPYMHLLLQAHGHLSANEKRISGIRPPLIEVILVNLSTFLHDLASQTEIGNKKFTSTAQVKTFN